MKNRLIAYANLAYRFGVHVLRLPARPLRKGRDASRFLATVQPEGFVPLPAGARAEFPRYMRCMNCGLCALAAGDVAGDAWADAWTYVAGTARALDNAALVAASTPATARDARAEAVCPMGVPITRLALLPGTLRPEGQA